jgi:prepilin-type N-terminal cleavage/methylation domain-containing protein
MKTRHFKLMTGRCPSHRHAGMTLVEVVVAMAISALAVGAIMSGYAFCTTSARKAALSMAANARAMERIEQTRSAKWDTATWPIVDELVATNFPAKTVALDLSGAGVAITPATIQTVITQISAAPPLRRIRVDCIWQFLGVQRVTNTIETCRAPDQ